MKNHFLPYVPAFTLLAAFQFGCEKGGCYYSCCIEENDCMTHCSLGENTAESCTIYAQQECGEGDGGYVTRVEWTSVSELICNDCGSAACAPVWWSSAQIKETISTDTPSAQIDSTSTDTASE